jgi:hypothetical protein
VSEEEGEGGAGAFSSLRQSLLLFSPNSKVTSERNRTLASTAGDPPGSPARVPADRATSRARPKQLLGLRIFGGQWVAVVGDLGVKEAEAEAKDGVIVKGGAAGGGAGVAEERRHHRRAPHEDHCPAQGQRAYAPPLPSLKPLPL